MTETVQAHDPQRVVGPVLRAIRKAYGRTPFRTVELVVAAEERHTLRAALARACGKERFTKTDVSAWLMRHRGIKSGTLRLARKKYERGQRWVYAVVAEGDPLPPAPRIPASVLAEMRREENPRPPREPKPPPFVDSLPPPGPAEGVLPPGAYDRPGQVAPVASSQATLPAPEPLKWREIFQVDAGAAPRYLPQYSGAGPERGIFPAAPVPRRWSPFD